MGDVLDSYEKMRAAFAADDNKAALSFAQPLADASKKAADAATDASKPTLTELAGATAKLATDKPAELKAARLLFADISKQLVTLLVADPKLREGRFLMECPMAPAYKRWVQTTPALRNPYWGSEMLECGSEIKDWSV
jgi:Cu(I)/Ag(I) efflux system membrane fusion protein